MSHAHGYTVTQYLNSYFLGPRGRKRQQKNLSVIGENNTTWRVWYETLKQDAKRVTCIHLLLMPHCYCSGPQLEHQLMKHQRLATHLPLWARLYALFEEQATISINELTNNFTGWHKQNKIAGLFNIRLKS